MFEKKIDEIQVVQDQVYSNSFVNRGKQTQDKLRAYLSRVQSYPLLEQEEELELFDKLHYHNDKQAASRIINAYLRLVVKLAFDFNSKWQHDLLDLVQEGNEGLLKALHRYDPNQGSKFSYYASYWIKAYMHKFIMNNWKQVKVGTTQPQRKLFYNLGKEKRRLETQGVEANAYNLSRTLDVKQDDIMEMDKRMKQPDLSLDTPIEENTLVTRLDTIPSREDDPEKLLSKQELTSKINQSIQTLLPHLPKREQKILHERLLAQEPRSLREISANFGVSRERIRQIESRLKNKLRWHFSSSIKELSPELVEDAFQTHNSE